MPLSDHEQRLLEQMEQALLSEDPKFASAMEGSDVRRRYRRRVILAVVVFFAGIAMLMTGAVTQIIALGVAGFVIMLASAWYAVTGWRRMSAAGEDSGNSAATVTDISSGSKRRRGRQRKERNSSSFVERMEKRWRDRRERGE